MTLLPKGIDNRLVTWRAKDKQVDVFIHDVSGLNTSIHPWSATFYAKRFPVSPYAPVDVSVSGTLMDGSMGFTFDLSAGLVDVSVGDYIYEVKLNDSYWWYRSYNNYVTVVQDRFQILRSLNTD